MDAPNMASIQGSLQNCSLQRSSEPSLVGGDSPEISSVDVADPALELNSEVAVPFYWEQCLDLKTGEIYFVNWITGAKAKDYPGFVETSSDDDSSWYDSSDVSSFSDSSSTDDPENNETAADFDDVLVVVGCKACLMYYMVPRKLDICPKCCCAHLLHFD